MDDSNPWDVSSLDDFLFYCCPKCVRKEPTTSDFIQHAIECHPESQKYVEKLSKAIFDDLKEEIAKSDTNPDEKQSKRTKVQLKLRISKDSGDMKEPAPDSDIKVVSAKNIWVGNKISTTVMSGPPAEMSNTQFKDTGIVMPSPSLNILRIVPQSKYSCRVCTSDFEEFNLYQIHMSERHSLNVVLDLPKQVVPKRKISKAKTICDCKKARYNEPIKSHVQEVKQNEVFSEEVQENGSNDISQECDTHDPLATELDSKTNKLGIDSLGTNQECDTKDPLTIGHERKSASISRPEVSSSVKRTMLDFKPIRNEITLPDNAMKSFQDVEVSASRKSVSTTKCERRKVTAQHQKRKYRRAKFIGIDTDE